MIDPCEECLIKTMCGDLCDPRKEYSADIQNMFDAASELFYKKKITRDEYNRIGSQNQKVRNEDYIINLRGGHIIEYGSSSCSSSSCTPSSQYIPPTQSKKGSIKSTNRLYKKAKSLFRI